ncbi:hypothetical protein N0V83_004340 [Neocucurbitaria cava]|uniref:Uncharacterized protein n=1 Tax=Neocucurbitaria cava TaxID=798079 RepID=A0A9W8Y8Y3_9PLEO|nr:hypothetical protein N0V83_004340 [Neocucurbitaria cava]
MISTPTGTPQDTTTPHRRRPLMPNILSTLIAAPPGGFTTLAVRERMKHHITDLDDYLLLSDEKVGGWSDVVLVGMTSQIVLQWQWLRQNNEILGDMEVGGWEELEGKADECEWIAEEVRKPGAWGKRERRGGGGAGGGADGGGGAEMKDLED